MQEQALTDGVAELTLETRDLQAMERFDGEVLDCRVLSREDDRIWLACGRRTRLGLWFPGDKEFGDEGGRHVHFALAASRGRIDHIVEHLHAAGAPCRGPVEHGGGDRSLYTEDPEGNVLEIWDYFHDGDGAQEGVDGLS
jgi:catechol-2,3-dioxygenase